MKNIALFVVVLLTSASACISYLNPRRIDPVPRNISVAVIQKCDAVEKVRCNMNCRDGWGFTGYYDSLKHVPGSLRGGMYFPPETRKALLGIYYSAVCNRCSVSFTLNKKGRQESVSCEEFFQFMEDYNRGCGNCLKLINAGF